MRVAPKLILLAAALALLPTLGYADSPDNTVVATSPVVVTTNQTGIGVNICGANCVQIVYVVNIAIININIGAGKLPKLSVDPTMVDFGAVRVGRPSPDHAITLTNADKGPATVADAAVAGPQSTDFGLQPSTCLAKGSPTSLAPGASCNIDLFFTPGAPGMRVGALHFAVNKLIYWVPLLGVGTQPELGLSANSLDFGKVAVGRTGPPRDLSLRNVGSGPLTFTAISAEGDFAQSDDCLPSASRTALPPGAACTVHVTFTPTARRLSPGLLTLASDAPGSPHSVTLSGTGIKPAAQIVPSRLKFAGQPVNQPGAPQALVVTNSGLDPLEITDAQLSGPNATSFARTSDCPASLAPAASCAIRVTFLPLQTGELSATLLIQDNAADSPQSVGLSGLGQPAPAAAAPATALPSAAAGGAPTAPATPALPAVTTPAAGGPVAAPTPPPAAPAAPAPAAPAPPPPATPAPAVPPPTVPLPAPPVIPLPAAVASPAPASDPAPAQGATRQPQIGSLQPDPVAQPSSVAVQPAGAAVAVEVARRPEGRSGGDGPWALSAPASGSGVVGASPLDPAGSRLLRDEDGGVLKGLPRAAALHRGEPAGPPWPRAFDWLLLLLLAGVVAVWVTLFRARVPGRDCGLLVLDDGIEST